MAGNNNLINELLEKTTKQHLLDDWYYAYSKKLELQERVKELEEKLEIFDFFPTDIQKEKFKDLKQKLYKLLVDNHP